MAAACYAVSGLENDGEYFEVERLFTDRRKSMFEDAWPWDPEYDKREEHPRLRRLVIAGALIAAEIDRLNRDISGKAIAKAEEKE